MFKVFTFNCCVRSDRPATAEPELDSLSHRQHSNSKTATPIAYF